MYKFMNLNLAVGGKVVHRYGRWDVKYDTGGYSRLDYLQDHSIGIIVL